MGRSWIVVSLSAMIGLGCLAAPRESAPVAAGVSVDESLLRPGPPEWPNSVREAARDFLQALSKEDQELLKFEFYSEFGSIWQRLGPQVRDRYGLWVANEELIRASASAKSATFAILLEAREQLREVPPDDEWILGREEWATTVDDAARDMLEQLSEEDREEMREGPRETLWRYHFSLGMAIRNRHGLWRGNEALRAVTTGSEYGDPDAASGVILERMWELLQE